MGLKHLLLVSIVLLLLSILIGITLGGQSLSAGLMSQLHFEGSVRSPFTLPKMGFESSLGFSKIQNAIAGVKTPCNEVFIIPLENS